MSTAVSTSADLGLINRSTVAPNNSSLLLFYPTSPVHVRDLRLVLGKLPNWRCQAIVYSPLARVAPGIVAALKAEAVDSIFLDSDSSPEELLPRDAAILVLGAVFEPFALELIAWAKRCGIPVVAIQEVAQLALNQNDINNYDAPFDRLFVASPDEHERFVNLGYPPGMLRISGLIANERLSSSNSNENDVLNTMGLGAGKKPIVYTTSPLCSRLSLHNKDDPPFRQAVLRQIAEASRRTGRPVVIKLHPNEEVETGRRSIRDILPQAIVLGRNVNMDELFAATGVLVNRGNSQTCLDAVLRGIPTVVAACGLKTLFHEDGGAYVIDEISQLATAIERADRDGPADPTRVQAKHFFLPPEGVAWFIAKQFCDTADSRQPADERTWTWLVKSMLFVGDYNRALNCLAQIAERTPHQETVCLSLKAHVEGRLQDAIEGWHNVIDLDAHWYLPHYELAHGYLAAGDYSRAIEHAEKALALHPPFHSLWHEIPMRVVVMSSLRQSGHPHEAAAVMETLEKRGFLNVMPELLTEKAVQLGAVKGQLITVAGYLDNAFDQLKAFPVHEPIDAQLRDRAFILTSGLIEQCEQQSLYWVAERLCLRQLEVRPDDTWSNYQLARARLMQGKISKALKGLHRITRIPNGPLCIFDRVLSPAAAGQLASYWPASPKSILKPIKVVVWVSAWAVAKLIRSRLKELADAAATSLLVAIFVLRHFFRRLSSEIVALRRIFRMLRAYLPHNRFNRFHQVKDCPICGGHSKFEYKNKLTPLFRCSQCNHVYAGRLPDDQGLSQLYGDVSYWEKDRMHQGITSMQESAEWQVYLSARLGILQRLNLLPPSPTPGQSVFEIGCAEGMLLHALKTRGMKVSGCEMNRAVAAQGMKNLGIDIRTEPFESLTLPQHDCDLVISFHTLEHMRYPVEVIAKVAHLLRADGSVLIEVPCGEEEYENTDHLHFFSKTSLQLLLDRFFARTEIIDNAYTNSAGVRIGSIYGVGRRVRHRPLTPSASQDVRQGGAVSL